MSITLPAGIFNLPGQVVKMVRPNSDSNCVEIHCRRDMRRKVVEPGSQQPGTINRYVSRWVTDLPLNGQRCIIKVELAEVRLPNGKRRLEACDFVEKKVTIPSAFAS